MPGMANESPKRQNKMKSDSRTIQKQISDIKLRTTLRQHTQNLHLRPQIHKVITHQFITSHHSRIQNSSTSSPADLWLTSTTSSQAALYCKGTLSPFPFFSTALSLSIHSGDLSKSWSLCGTSGILETVRVPVLTLSLWLALLHFETHHCTVPSHVYSVYVFSCIPSKVL